jgi:hypothetical protein
MKIKILLLLLLFSLNLYAYDTGIYSNESETYTVDMQPRTVIITSIDYPDSAVYPTITVNLGLYNAGDTIEYYLNDVLFSADTITSQSVEKTITGLIDGNNKIEVKTITDLNGIDTEIIYIYGFISPYSIESETYYVEISDTTPSPDTIQFNFQELVSVSEIIQSINNQYSATAKSKHEAIKIINTNESQNFATWHQALFYLKENYE